MNAIKIDLCLRSSAAGIACSVLILLMLSHAANVSAQTAEKNSALRSAQAGFEFLKTKDYRSAVDAFEQAIRSDDAVPAAHLGLGTAYFYLKEDRLSQRELERAAELNPRDPVAYQILGELSYRKDDLETAASFWQKALDLDPSNGAVKARLDRIQREHRTEKDFNQDVTSHFLIKYEGREKIETGRIVLKVLEDAYSEIGRALSFYPDQEIQVILYSNRQFQEVTDAPGWSGGIYDGKIRIPIAGIEQETPGLRRLLYHEYTHVVVRSIAPRVPAWLNEGLAQHFEGREMSDSQQVMLRRIAQAEKLPSLRQLEGSFAGLGGSEAAFAYLFSLSAVRFMIDNYGLYRLRMVLDELAAGADVAKAVNSALMRSYEDLDREWRQSLE